MRASGGVVAAAIVAGLGSLLTLGFGLLMIVVLALRGNEILAQQRAQMPNQPQALVGIIIAVCALYVLLGGLGLWTAIDLIRLRRWARWSILIFSGIWGSICLLSAVVFLLMPFPPVERAEEFVPVMRAVMVGFYGFFVAIAVWWLILFTRRSVAAQFRAGTSSAPASSRPISVSIIGWLLIVGSAFAPVSVLLRFPLPLLSIFVDGWKAAALHATFGVISLTIGIGLLQLRETARKAALAWLTFGIVNSALTALRPGAMERMMEWSARWSGQQPIQFPMAVWFGMAIGLGFNLVMGFFLLKNQAAFRASTALA